MKSKRNGHLRLAVFGTRTLSGDAVQEIILSEIKLYCVDSIVTAGDARGVCATAIILCRQTGFPLKLYFLDVGKARGKYYHRSVSILSECDRCLFIWNGTSK